MPLNQELAEKSVLAAIAAIEIYNKPNFSYREEAFALLMSNAWELLLKAKWLLDHGDALESLYEFVIDERDRKSLKQTEAGIHFLTAPAISQQN